MNNIKTMSNKDLVGELEKCVRFFVYDKNTRYLFDSEIAERDKEIGLFKTEILSRMKQPDVVKLKVK